MKKNALSISIFLLFQLFANTCFSDVYSDLGFDKKCKADLQRLAMYNAIAEYDQQNRYIGLNPQQKEIQIQKDLRAMYLSRG